VQPDPRERWKSRLVYLEHFSNLSISAFPSSLCGLDVTKPIVRFYHEPLAQELVPPLSTFTKSSK